MRFWGKRNRARSVSCITFLAVLGCVYAQDPEVDRSEETLQVTIASSGES